MIKLSHHVVSISTAAGELTGCMSEPQPGHALVLFAQGSGSSRLSPRNREMAKTLESAGFGTLLFDLLTDEEELNYGKRFDIPIHTIYIGITQSVAKEIRHGTRGQAKGGAIIRNDASVL